NLGKGTTFCQERKELRSAPLDGTGTGLEELPEVSRLMCEGTSEECRFHPSIINCLIGIRMIRIPIESFAKTMEIRAKRVGRNTGFAYGSTSRRFSGVLKN
ncbi:hypothetical protein, partial [Deinococcus frigens]|uniref:hypothetical protein n=1 Tax=Deinococcus frigens TaxID=249403 RepID=UPI0039EE6B40